ncbi:MAG: hypothetical protein MUE85_22395 [Microscillaceae bacterium]|jgi:hypothetical protein|nr:hypothetical protein [Microscillaceae bacterium]
MRTFVISLAILLVGGACTDLDDRAIDSKQVTQAIKDRKPQRITEKLLLDWVSLKGQLIARIGQKNLFRAVNQALSTQKIKTPAEFYKLEKIAGLDSLAQVYRVKIQKIAFDNASDIELSSEEKQLLKTYETGEGEISTQVKALPKTNQILFVEPIFFDNAPVGMWSILFDRDQARRLYDYKDLKLGR